jgi:hypothetical protein
VTAAFEIFRNLRGAGFNAEKLERIPYRAHIADPAIDDGNGGH